MDDPSTTTTSSSGSSSSTTTTTSSSKERGTAKRRHAGEGEKDGRKAGNSTGDIDDDDDDDDQGASGTSGGRSWEELSEQIQKRLKEAIALDDLQEQPPAHAMASPLQLQRGYARPAAAGAGGACDGAQDDAAFADAIDVRCRPLAINPSALMDEALDFSSRL